jgi:3-hydroxyacyl-[acyl-carrier-protein] dehydratase
MSESKQVDFEVIKNILPHRYPFLLVDRVLDYDEKSIKALKNITANEEFFTGHFPLLAAMPGVLQVEAMAQAAGLILGLNQKFDQANNLAFLAGVDQARFKRMVSPGDQLIIKAHIVAQRTGLFKFEARISVEEQLVSSASIVLVVRAR